MWACKKQKPAHVPPGHHWPSHVMFRNHPPSNAGPTDYPPLHVSSRNHWLSRALFRSAPPSRAESGNHHELIPMTSVHCENVGKGSESRCLLNSKHQTLPNLVLEAQFPKHLLPRKSCAEAIILVFWSPWPGENSGKRISENDWKHDWLSA